MRFIPFPTEARSIRVPQVSGPWKPYTPDVDVQMLLFLGVQTSGDIVELGCNQGVTTAKLASYFPEKRIIGVDTPQAELVPQQEYERPSLAEIGVVARGFPNVAIHTLHSQTLAYGDIAPKATLVFIDADHSYSGVAADTERALSFLRSRRGQRFLVWHDYRQEDHEWLRVGEFLRDTHKRYKDLQVVQGTSLAFSPV